MDTVEPDGQGRIPLHRFTKKVAEEYLISVSDNGIVTLTPTVVRAALLSRAEAIVPDFAGRLDAVTASGSHSSDLWKHLDRID